MNRNTTARRLIDDCFLNDAERMRHGEVIALLLERLTAVTGTETVPLAEAHRRIAASDMRSPRPVPLHQNAAVDGYAFSHAGYIEHSGRFALAGRIAAGDPRELELSQDQCARIFTGAAMPIGADTVAMQEDCTVRNGEVFIPDGLRTGANCRNAGEDLAEGDTVIAAGQFLRPQDIAALASLGLAEVAVRTRLRVAVMSTGNELSPPGGSISHGQVFDSNGIMLKTLVEAAGGTVTQLGIIPDSPEEISRAISDSARNHDLVLTSGGASRGEEDHILDALDALGTRHLWQIAVKPGRPMMFGQIGDCVIIGLPGNPVAAFVCFLLYVRAAMHILGGATYREPVRFPVAAAFEIPGKKPDRREFLRGFLQTGDDGTLTVSKYAHDGSGLISGLRAADGLIEIDEDVTAVAKGDTVAFIPFNQFWSF